VPSGTTGRALHQLLASRLASTPKNARLALLRGEGCLEMSKSLEEMGDLVSQGGYPLVNQHNYGKSPPFYSWEHLLFRLDHFLCDHLMGSFHGNSWDFHDDDPLVMTNIAMERSTIFNGKIQY